MFAKFPSNCIVENKNSKRKISAQEEASQHILGNTKGQLISECLKFSQKPTQKFDKFLPSIKWSNHKIKTLYNDFNRFKSLYNCM